MQQILCSLPEEGVSIKTKGGFCLSHRIFMQLIA
jgi:hypothetical protein